MSERPKILIVDDHPGNRLALRTVLRVVEAEIQEAANGLDALSMVVEEDYALILLDVQMPEMDGYEVCEQLRFDPKTADTPVIFLTAAYKEDVDKIRGYVAGATDYLAKPIDDHVLRSKVAVFLKLYSQSQLLKQSESRIRAILENALDAVVGIDECGRIVRWNQRARIIFGWSQEEAMGRMIKEIIVPKKEGEDQSLVRFLTSGDAHLLNRRIEITAMRRSGEEFPIEMAITPFQVDDSWQYTAFIADITLRKAAEKRIGFLANHDPLTELPNRVLFFDRLSQGMSEARRRRTCLSVLYLDLDGFKGVNDNYGHEIGDVTLKTVAQRLKSCVREMDSVARMGGDEFAILLGDVQGSSDTGLVASKIIRQVSEPMVLPHGGTYAIGVSIGIALYPQSGSEIDTLMKAADCAMYQSKAQGRNQYTVSGEHATASAVEECWVDIADSQKMGIEVIDSQHLQIASMLNGLNDAIKRGHSIVTVTALLEKLVGFTQFHFETEARLMRSYGYPEEASHNDAHRYLINEVAYLKQRIEEGSQRLLLQWLKDWFLSHLTNSDLALGAFLREHGEK
ncbi:MAG: bacteriohemerythrin [Anaerolineales bacterium]|nr:bacteriohemerythrin [Anaerolineales bacterium]